MTELTIGFQEYFDEPDFERNDDQSEISSRSSRSSLSWSSEEEDGGDQIVELHREYNMVRDLVTTR